MKIILTAQQAKKQYQTREALYKLIHTGDALNIIKSFIKFYGENCLFDDLTNAINSAIKQETYGNTMPTDGQLTFGLGLLNGHLSILNDVFNSQFNAYASAVVNSDGTTEVNLHVLTTDKNTDKIVKILSNKPQQTLSNKIKASIKEISSTPVRIDATILYTTDVTLKQMLTSTGYTPVKSSNPDRPFEFTVKL